MPKEGADATTQVPFVLTWLAEYQSVVDPNIRVLVVIEPVTGRLSSVRRSPAEY